MSEGANARTWVFFQVSADAASALPGAPLIAKGTKLFTRIPRQSTLIADDPRVYDQADVGFETMEDVHNLYVDHNELHFYSWSDRRCCLPKGATRATLEGHHPDLTPGIILVFEELLGPETGSAADADPTRRHARSGSRRWLPRRWTIQNLTDPVTGADGTLLKIVGAPRMRCPFPLSLGADAAGYRAHVSVARGNLALADHGLTRRDEALGKVPEPYLFNLPPPNRDRCVPAKREPIFPRFGPRLEKTPLTHAAPPYDHVQSARAAMHWSLRDVQPSITLASARQRTAEWRARRDLLSSSAARRNLSPRSKTTAARVRFGDDHQGKRPEAGTAFKATYRVGNGKAGNIGADSLAHIAANVPQIVTA